jgi:hypothetical protein
MMGIFGILIATRCPLHASAISLLVRNLVSRMQRSSSARHDYLVSDRDLSVDNQRIVTPAAGPQPPREQRALSEKGKAPSVHSGGLLASSKARQPCRVLTSLMADQTATTADPNRAAEVLQVTSLGMPKMF